MNNLGLILFVLLFLLITQERWPQFLLVAFIVIATVYIFGGFFLDIILRHGRPKK